MTKQDSIDKLVKEMAKIYNFTENGELWNGDYDSQAKSQTFVKILTYNCLLMDSLYHCSDRGCDGCVAEDVFRKTEDEGAKAIIKATKSALAERREARHD